MTKAEFHKQCVVESFRSGDHVAIKITHVPTGMYEMDSTMTSEFRTRERLLDDLMLRVSIQYSSAG